MVNICKKLKTQVIEITKAMNYQCFMYSNLQIFKNNYTLKLMFLVTTLMKLNKLYNKY